MSSFYRYTKDAFKLVPFSEIKRGDKLSWASDYHMNLYGAIEIAEIRGGVEYLIFVLLPEGAEVTSNGDREVSVRWKDGKWQISVCMHYSGESLSPRMILR